MTQKKEATETVEKASVEKTTKLPVAWFKTNWLRGEECWQAEGYDNIGHDLYTTKKYRGEFEGKEKAINDFVKWAKKNGYEAKQI